MKKVLFLIVSMLCMLAGCSDGGSDTLDPEPQPEEAASITCSTTSLSFGHEGGEQMLSFTANRNWNISVPSSISWCVISQTAGSAGTFNVSIKVAESQEYEERNATLSIKCGDAMHHVVLTQKQKDALLVTTNQYEVGKDGGTIELEVKANISYQLEIAEADKTWIKETTGRAFSSYKHTLKIEASDEYDKREGTLYVKSGDKTETIKVYQSGEAVLLLTTDEYTVSDKGETITVEIKSNFEYSVQMPEADWIKEEDSSRGLSSHTVKYVISPNESYDSRSAEIVFYDNNSSLKDTLTVIQAQKDAIILSQKEITVGSSSCTVEANVNTNIEFETKILNAEWITEKTTSRGLTEYAKLFTIAENQTNGNRTGQVVFLNTSKGIADTLTINQVKNDVLIISQKIYEVNDSETTIDVKYQTNLELEYIIPDEFSGWIKIGATSRSLSEYSQSFIISTNNGYDTRNGYILFKDKNSDLQETVQVIQAQKDAIILSRKEYEIAAQGGNITVSYESNVTVTIASNCDWIKIKSVSTRALTSSSFVMEIIENKSYKTRTGTVTISSTDGSLSKNLSITQGAKSTDGSMENIDDEQEKEW